MLVEDWFFFSVGIKCMFKVNEILINVCLFGFSSISCDFSDLFRLLMRLLLGCSRNCLFLEKILLYKL